MLLINTFFNYSVIIITISTKQRRATSDYEIPEICDIKTTTTKVDSLKIIWNSK